MYYAYVFHDCINKLKKISTEFSRDISFKEGNFGIAYYVFCGDSMILQQNVDVLGQK